MTGKSHILLGVATGIMLQRAEFDYYNIFIVGATVIGSMAPDLDHGKSKISKKVPILSWFVSKVFGHRKFFHSPLIVIILWLLLHSSFIGRAFVFGFIGHLVQDFLTRGGIPLLYPYKKRFSLPLAKTGGFMEILITIMMIVVLYTIKTL